MIRNDCNISARAFKCDQRNMTADFREAFEEIVNEEHGFMRGGDSYLVVGTSANEDCEVALACLFRGNYAVYRLTPEELCRRLNGQEVFSNDELDGQFRDAECIFVYDMFEPEIIEAMPLHSIASVRWYITEAVRLGVCIVLPINKSADDIDLAINGELFSDFIEARFERIG